MQESNQATLDAPRKFNLFSKNDPVQSFFGVKPLEESESIQIEKLLVDNFQPGIIEEVQVERDISDLKVLTSEIKAINKQGILLIGERIYKARGILQNYKNGTFVKWIDSTFESRRTGYNMLSYYELYHSLPSQAKENLKKMPQTAAYMLASRPGEIEKKADIITNYHDLKYDDMKLLIEERLPANSRFKPKKDANSMLIESIRINVETLRNRKNDLSEENKQALLNIMISIEAILN